jgi:hypothetical protein
VEAIAAICEIASALIEVLCGFAEFFWYPRVAEPRAKKG